MNLIKIKDLQSVSFFSSYKNWAENIKLTENKLINTLVKAVLLSLSTFVFLGSIFIFVFRDIPVLAKNAYNSCRQSNSGTLQFLKPFFVAGSAFLAYQTGTSVIKKIQSIKTKALITGAVSIIGLGIAAYSIAHLRVI